MHPKEPWLNVRNLMYITLKNTTTAPSLKFAKETYFTQQKSRMRAQASRDRRKKLVEDKAKLQQALDEDTDTGRRRSK